MASKTCSTCLRAVYRQSRSIPQVRKLLFLKYLTVLTQNKARPAARFYARSFTSTPNRYVELPEPNATPATSIPPVTPDVGKGGATTLPLGVKAAAGLKRATGNATETYTAYGATEVLYKECARQAQYSIPQATSETDEVPKTEDGEDVGIGEGWWIKGNFSLPCHDDTELTISRTGSKANIQYLVAGYYASHVPPRSTIPLLRTSHLQTMATTSPRSFLLRRREQDDDKPRHACAGYPKQVSEGSLHPVEGITGGL